MQIYDSFARIDEYLDNNKINMSFFYDCNETEKLKILRVFDRYIYESVNVRHFNEYPRHLNPLVMECSDNLFSQIKTKIVKIISELPITQQQLFYFSL